MLHRGTGCGIALALAAAAAGCAGPGTADAERAPTVPSATTGNGELPARDDFEDGKTGAPPPGFVPVTTIGNPKFPASLATWAVADDPAAPSGTRVVRLAATKNREEIFNVLLREQPRLADVALAVKIRPDAGLEDRGGGLVWRVRDAQNYYLCRWNPIEKNLRAYRVEAGKRIQLQSVAIEADPAAWHQLAVTMKGRVIAISFDGTPAISCADATWPDAGQVGLWTKADAKSSFDDFEVAEAR